MNPVSFAVRLIDQMSGPSKAAASSMSSLTRELRTAKSELAAFQRIKVGAKEFGSSGDFLRASDAARQARERVYELSKQGAGVGGAPVAAVQSLTSTFGPLIGVATIGATIITSMAAAYGSLAVKALEAADAEKQLNRDLLGTLTALSGGDSGKGKATFDVVDTLSRRLPQSRAEIADWTKALQESGITDPGVLRKGVTALASSSAIAGPGGAEALLGTIRKVQEAIETGHGIKLADKQLASLAKTGANVDDVAKEMGLSTKKLQQELKAGTVNAGTFGDALLNAVEKKGKLPLSQMGDDLSVIYRKALEFGSRLFKNVDLRPLTDELDSMYHLLDQTTAAGAKLGDGVAKGTSGIASAFGEAIDKAQVWYLKTATFALKVDTALMPVEKTIRRITSAMDTTVGKLLLATATLGLYDATGHSKPVIKQTSAITNGRKTLFDAAAAVRVARLSGALKGEELQKAGDSLADSLAAGYRQGMIEREDIIRLEGVALGKAAVAGIKEGQKSHSPSRATMQLGGYLGQGLVLGMRGHAGEVGRAGHFLGAHAVASIGGRTGGSGTSRAAAFSFNGARERRGESRGASGGKSIQISRLELNVNAPHGVTDATEVTAAGVAIALEHLQLMSGA